MSNRFVIDIELFPATGAPAPDAAQVQAAVQAGLADWWPALGLPDEPAIRVALSAEAADLFDFSIRLDGKVLPVPVLSPGYPMAPLAFRIEHTLFVHRQALITDEALRQIRHRCLAETHIAHAWTSAPQSVWRELARRLLANGFSLDRLRACFDQWNPEKSVDETFEALVEQPENLRLTLQVSPALVAAQAAIEPGWAARFVEYYTNIYQDWGILLPEIVVEQPADWPFERFGLRLNDLQVPVLPGLAAGQMLYDVPGFESAGMVYQPLVDQFLSTAPNPAHPGMPAVSGPWSHVLDWMKYWVGQCAGWYVNTGIVDGLLDTLEEDNRSLIVMIREQWPTHRLCSLLRELLAEQVSIRNLPEILDVLLRIEGPLVVDDTEYLLYFTPVSRVVTVPPGVLPGEFGLAQWAGQVRAGLKFPVVFPHLRNGVLPCYNFDPAVLRDLRDGFFAQALPLPGSVFYEFLKSIRDTTDDDFPRPVFLTPTGIRPAVVKALRPYFPQLVVIGHEELPAFFIPQVKNTIK